MSDDNLCHEHFPNNTVQQNGRTSEERSHNHRSRVSTGRLSPTHSAHGCLMRMSLQKMCLEKKAKKVRFFRNGDKFFKGLLYALSTERIRTFDALLEDLTRILVDQVNLPKGVRHIYTADGKEKLTTLEQFQEGACYVCSSVDGFAKLTYGRHANPQWSMLKKNEKNVWKSEWIEDVKDARDYVRPKLVTVIKNGVKPRKAVRILLNKKTAHSFDQVLNDITKAIKLDAGAVRKIFTLGGKQVNSLADFFAEEDVFIAYGPEKYSHDDFDLDSDECKYVTGASSIGRKGKRSTFSFTNGGHISSSSCLIDGSPFSSGRSSLTSSPRSMRKFQPKSGYSRQSSQNGHSISVYFPREILDHYLIGKLIGDGNFATVHECTDRTTKKEYAMKVIDKTKCKGKEHLIANEVAILRRVRHPNIVQLLEEFDMTNDLYMVMELVKGGDLFDAIQSATKYTERDASGMVYNLASALKYLHSLNIVHRDIKPENLLVVNHEDGSRSLKLGDFGLAVEVKDLLYTVCGTPTYVAPEILAETGYGLKVDIWAAGVITYILLCGFPPFVSQSNDQDELFDQILLGKYEFTPPFWDKISQAAKDLINCMLEVNVEKRIAAAQVLESKWIEEDTAPENDMQVTVSRKLSANFEHKANLKPAGIALIALTPMDKESDCFIRRPASRESVRQLQLYSAVDIAL